MPGLLIKNVPPKLSKKLKVRAALHHRSMTREALAILEESLEIGDRRMMRLPEPIKLKVPLTRQFVAKAKRWGRA